jgi:hypothetical protein
MLPPPTVGAIMAEHAEQAGKPASDAHAAPRRMTTLCRAVSLRAPVRAATDGDRAAVRLNRLSIRAPCEGRPAAGVAFILNRVSRRPRFSSPLTLVTGPNFATRRWHAAQPHHRGDAPQCSNSARPSGTVSNRGDFNQIARASKRWRSGSHSCSGRPARVCA